MHVFFHHVLWLRGKWPGFNCCFVFLKQVYDHNFDCTPYMSICILNRDFTNPPSKANPPKRLQNAVAFKKPWLLGYSWLGWIPGRTNFRKSRLGDRYITPPHAFTRHHQATRLWLRTLPALMPIVA